MTLTIGEPVRLDEGICGLVAQVAKAACERPQATAVASSDGQLSYGQLWSGALDVAARLRESGVRRGDVVALCLPRSASLVVGALGVLAAGGCYLALDPGNPDDRLAVILADSGARMVVAPADVAVRIGAARWIEPGEQPASAGFGPVATAADDPAYVVYTSGSTGQPKGVVVEHAGLVNLVDWHRGEFAITESDCSALVSSPSFDASVWEMWSCLAAGASLHIPPDAVKTDPLSLRDWLVAERITTTFVPTPLCETLIALEWPATTALRLMLTGGDLLHRRPRPGLPFTLVNNYGVAEATVVSTSGTVAPAEASGGNTELPALGSPISGVHLAVVGADGRPVPAGSPGELVVSGVSVARGYLGHEELNRTKFFVDAAGRRCYRTGDLVRLRPDGQLAYLGRLDDQVQIRGVRVELAEIAAVLGEHPRVSASTVVAVGGGERLSAYVVGTAGRPPATAELRQHLSQRLPAHMVPADCTVLAELPTTPSGKIDRQLLRERGPQLAGRDELTAARSDLERSVAVIAADVLWLPEIGIDEDFFALGGHSLLGAQLSIRIGERFGIEVPLRSVFENPTVAELAVEVKRLLMADIEGMSADELLRAAADLNGDDSGGSRSG